MTENMNEAAMVSLFLQIFCYFGTKTDIFDYLQIVQNQQLQLFALFDTSATFLSSASLTLTPSHHVEHPNGRSQSVKRLTGSGIS